MAFGHHMQIVDIARLGKVGGIQKVAAKLLLAPGDFSR